MGLAWDLDLSCREEGRASWGGDEDLEPGLVRRASLSGAEEDSEDGAWVLGKWEEEAAVACLIQGAQDQDRWARRGEECLGP